MEPSQSVGRVPSGGVGRGGWASLGLWSRAWRIAHASWSAVQLACLAQIWTSAVRRRRDRLTRVSAALLVAEGTGLVIGRGDCPVGGLQERWGDPVPLFELVLPRRAAKAAVPILAVVAVGGLAALALRPPPPGQGERPVLPPPRPAPQPRSLRRLPVRRAGRGSASA